jgi:hypothetical protein
MSVRPVHSLKLPRYEIVDQQTQSDQELAIIEGPTGQYVRVAELRKRLIDLQKQGKLSEETRVRLVTLMGLT